MAKKNKVRLGLTFNLENEEQADACKILEKVSPRKKAEYIATAIVFYNKLICNEYIDKLTNALTEKVFDKLTNSENNIFSDIILHKPTNTANIDSSAQEEPSVQFEREQDTCIDDDMFDGMMSLINT